MRHTLSKSLLFVTSVVLGCASSEEAGPEPEPAISEHGSALTLPANIVGNGDFEGSDYQLVTVPLDPWVGDAATTVEYGGEAYRNRHNALIRATSDWHAIQQTITVKPATRYRASGLFRTSANVNDGYFTATRIIRQRTGGRIIRNPFGGSTGTTVQSIFELANQIHFTAPMPEYTYQSFEFDTGNATSVVLQAGYTAPGSDSWLRADTISVHEVENRVNNSSFESGFTGWETGAASVTTGTGHAGAYSAIVQGTTGWNVAQQWVPVQRATEYRVGGWFRTSANANDIYFSVRGGATFDVINQLHLTAMSAGWEYKTFTFNSGNNDSVLLYAGFWAPGATSWIEVDEMSMTNNADLNVQKCVEDNYRIVNAYAGRTTNTVPTGVIGDKLELYVELQRAPQPASEENRMTVNGEKSSWTASFDASGHAWTPFWSAMPIGPSSPRSYTVAFPTICGTLTREVTVDIVSPTAPQNSISASPSSISSGGSSTLSWSATANPPPRTQCLNFTSRLVTKRASDGVVVSNETLGGQIYSTGTKVVSPFETTDYLLITTCDNSPWLQSVSVARVNVSAPSGGGGTGGGASVCYPDTPGLSTVYVVNNTGSDTLSIWRKHVASGSLTLIEDIGPGSVSMVSLPNCEVSEVHAVSRAEVDEHNARFGTSYDPHEAATADLGNFWANFVTPLLGRDSDPSRVDYIN